MKAFLNKKTSKKLIIVLIITAILSGFLPGFVQAKTDTENGGGMLEPIEKFVVYICDKLMQWLQTSFVSSDDIDEGDGTYNYQYSPAVIFSGTVPAFDINFISPNTDTRNTNNFEAYVRANKSKFIDAVEQETDMVTTVDNAETKLNSKYTDKLNEYENKDGVSKYEWQKKNLYDPSYFAYYYEENNFLNICVFKYQVGSTGSGNATRVQYTYSFKEISQELTEDFLEEANAAITYTSTAGVLQSTIATWYNTLRRIALVGLLSVLVYVGIRIVLSSSTQDKAKYKGMLKDWLVAICLLFTLHYIMSAAIFIVNEISDIFATGETDVLLNTLRTDIYSGDSWGEVAAKVIMYVTIVILTITFTIQYIMRVIYMAFYTLIAPLITLTYPLDKIKDGQAQAFNMWIKEYIYTALVQVIHLVIYFVLVSSALELVTDYPLYAIIVMLFIKKAEGLIKKMFGFEDKETVKALGAAVTGGLVMKAINQISHKPPKGGKPGGGSGKESSGSVRTATNNPLGKGQGNGGGAKTAKGIENLGKDFLKTHGKGLASGIIGTGTGLAGGIIGLSSGLAQGDIGAALTGAIAGGTAGMNISKNLVNSATSIPGRYRKTVNSIKDTYRTGAYGEEAAKAMRFDEDFRKGSTYEAIKNNGNFSEEKLQTMLNAGITEKKAMTKILDSGMDVDSAVKYYEMAQKCPDSILYGDKSTLVRYLTDRNINEADAQVMAENIGKFK